MKLFDENLLEPLFRALRFRQSWEDLPKQVSVCIDLGCGPEMRYLSEMIKKKVDVGRYVGIDPLLSIDRLKEKASLDGVILEPIAKPVEYITTLPSESADLIVGFAFLEHIDDPQKTLLETVRVLKKGGKAIFTTPTKAAKPVLEFLSYRLGLVSRREIEEHKQYFQKEDLLNLLDENKQQVNIKHKYFEFGMNNYFVVSKR